MGNRGAAGVDAMGGDELKPYPQAHWKRIKGQRLEGRYRPQSVLRVRFPSPKARGTGI